MRNATPPRVISAMWLVTLVMAIGIVSGCARSPGASLGAAGTDGTVRSHRLAESATLPDESEDDADYDPWQSFNERIFSFNHDVLDGYVEPSEADAGETLALYGVGSGPYLVLPTMPPLTVRDAIGRGIDGALDPVSYFLPFVANQAKSIVTAVNERSFKLKLYADVEDSVLDLYSAARNGYLQRRARTISLAAQDQHEEWAWARSSPAAESASQTAASASGDNPT